MLLKSTTGGSAWTEIDQELSYAYCLARGSIYQGGEWDHDSDANTDPVMAVFKSANNGVSWNRNHINAVPGDVKTIAQHPSDSNIIFAGGERSSNRVGCLYKSTDSGTAWTEAGASEFNIPYYGVNDIAFDPFDNHSIYVAHDKGVFFSANDGADWNCLTQYIYHVYCLVADPTTPGRIFIGCNQKIYVTTDGGNNWNEMTTGLDIDRITCMDFDRENGLLYAGTDGGGVYRYETGTVVHDLSHPILPEEITLYQNYPNPFNSETEIRFEALQDGQVSLRIYDIRGRLIRTLLDNEISSGSKRIRWDGTDHTGRSAASGLYLVRLKSDEQVKTIKIILQK